MGHIAVYTNEETYYCVGHSLARRRRKRLWLLVASGIGSVTVGCCVSAMSLGLFSKQNLIIQTCLLGLGFCIALYSLYSLKVFVDIYNIPTKYLAIVQILFLVWNAVNDPLMGYMQDVGCGIEWIMDRRKVMLYAGPVWAAVSLIFWFPWSTTNPLIVAAHYLVALFTYDTLMTLVASAYCGICVEVGSDHKGRVNIIVLGEIFAVMAGIVIFPIDYLSKNMQDFTTFQYCCVGAAVLAAVLMIITGLFLEVPEKTKEEVELNPDGSPKEEELGTSKALRISWEIIREPRFLCLVGSNFFRMLRLVACDQFLIIFVESLLSHNGFMPIGSKELSMFYVAVRTLGRFLFLILFVPIQRLGAHPVIQALNVVGLISALTILYIGRMNYLALAAFILLENIICRCGVHGMYMIITGEVIDTDTKLHNRKSPLSTLIFTIKALFNKPAEQMSPILVLLLLDAGGYSAHKLTCGVGVVNALQHATTVSPSIDPIACSNLFDSMFTVVVGWPILCIVGESLFIGFDQYFKRKQSAAIQDDIHQRRRRASIGSIKSMTKAM